jgi:hypothetical protein
MGRVGSTRDPSSRVWVKIFWPEFNRVRFGSRRILIGLFFDLNFLTCIPWSKNRTVHHKGCLYLFGTVLCSSVPRWIRLISRSNWTPILTILALYLVTLVWSIRSLTAFEQLVWIVVRIQWQLVRFGTNCKIDCNLDCQDFVYDLHMSITSLHSSP